MPDHSKRAVNKQFSASARFYAESNIHSQGFTLELVNELAKREHVDLALDVATGAGHTALAIAKHSRQVIATDLSFEMLEVARSLSREQRVHNIHVLEADAEALSFRSDCFDLVTCRIAPHHFPRPDLFVGEVRRVLKNGGRFILVDTWVPDETAVKDFTNQIQTLRDPTHLKSLCTTEWMAILQGAHLQLMSLETWIREGEASFNEWVKIARAPPKQVQQLKERFRISSDRIKEALKIRVTNEDIFFQIPRIVLVARKGGLPA